MDDLEKNLSDMVLAPYIFKAMALIGVKRRAGSNMFRHQMVTLTILIDYKLIEPVLLKASVIHDLFEDAEGMPGVSREDIIHIDQDGQAVYDLVMEVTRRNFNGVLEPKSEYLMRIMTSGSWKARILKLADRISNMFDLGFVHEDAFFKKYVEETKQYILPFAEHINTDMFRELSDLVHDRENKLKSRQ
jgi:(p)ppGpp synthase/HD superfamily hydrolase